MKYHKWIEGYLPIVALPINATLEELELVRLPQLDSEGRIPKLTPLIPESNPDNGRSD